MTEQEYEQKYMLLKNLPDDETRGKHTVELLEEKYGKDFEYIEIRPMDVNDDFYRIIAYSDDNPEMFFEARVSLDGKKLRDEFAVKSACLEYSNKMLEKVSGMNGYLYLQMKSLIRGFELEETEVDIPQIQSINARNCYIFDFYYTEDENNEDDLYRIINEMFSEDHNIDGILNLYVLPEKVRERVQIYLESHDKIYMDFAEIIEKNRPMTVEIEKGQISISKEKWEERMGVSK